MALTAQQAQVAKLNDIRRRGLKVVEDLREIRAETQRLSEAVTEQGVMAWIADPNNTATIDASFEGNLAEGGDLITFLNRLLTWLNPGAGGTGGTPAAAMAKLPRGS